jgi:hypothetical protein
VKFKKSIALLLTIVSSAAFAKHHFNICYYNQTNSSVSYNNDGISKKWLHRGELTGSGTLAAGQSKCFSGVEDETIFSSDYITFYIGGNWIGIVNAGFRKPYVIAQDATSTRNGNIPHAVISGRDTYTLNIHVMNTNGEAILSDNSDPKITSGYITPRKFK